MPAISVHEVSHDDFWLWVMDTQWNIHPSIEQPDCSIWREQRSFQEVGRSYPGWRNPGDEQKFLLSDAAFDELQGIKARKPNVVPESP